MDRRWRLAVIAGDVAALEALLDEGLPVDARDRYSQTGLMLAAHRGHEAVVAELLARGADPDVSAKYGLTALMLAIIGGHESVAGLLVEAGADLTATGRGAPGFAGQTAYDMAQARGLQKLADALRRHGSG